VEADAYFEGRVGGDAWALYDEADRERALVDATTTIDARRFSGYRASDTQALAWPRSGVAYDGVAVSDSAIPVFVRNATCEQALARLTGAVTSDPTGLEQFSSLSVGPVSLTMTPGTAPAPGALAPLAQRLLAPVLAGGGANSFRVIPS